MTHAFVEWTTNVHPYPIHQLQCGCSTWQTNVGYVRNWDITHWGRVTQNCVGDLTIISYDNGLSPERRQAIIWTNAGILLIGPLVTNFSEILIEIHTFSFKKTHLKISSGKWRPFCLGLNVTIEVKRCCWRVCLRVARIKTILIRHLVSLYLSTKLFCMC